MKPEECVLDDLLLAHRYEQSLQERLLALPQPRFERPQHALILDLIRLNQLHPLVVLRDYGVLAEESRLAVLFQGFLTTLVLDVTFLYTLDGHSLMGFEGHIGC